MGSVVLGEHNSQVKERVCAGLGLTKASRRGWTDQITASINTVKVLAVKE